MKGGRTRQNETSCTGSNTESPHLLPPPSQSLTAPTKQQSSGHRSAVCPDLRTTTCTSQRSWREHPQSRDVFHPQEPIHGVLPTIQSSRKEICLVCRSERWSPDSRNPLPIQTCTVVGFHNQQMTQRQFCFDLIRRGLQPALKSAFSQFAVHTIRYQDDPLCM